jgi:glyoxylase-like metal-dependent hydrolase (beta-lactamase superfamily II)
MEEKHFGPVWFIPGENNGKYPYCHSIYIEGAGVLIDPASDREKLVRLREDPGVKTVWLSHAHEDHFMHLDLFDDLPLCTSKEDAPPLADLEALMDAYGLDGQYRDYWRPVMKEQFHYRSRKVSNYLRGGEIIDLDTVNVEVIDTPGHTPGHLSFFFKEPGVLFLGDYDLTPFGPWYGDVRSSIEETIDSVETLRKIPAKVWLTSHEKGIYEEEPGGLWESYLKVVRDREEKLMALLDEPVTMDDIVGACIIYGRPREPKAFYDLGERGHMGKHIEKLLKEGTIAMKDGRYYKL